MVRMYENTDENSECTSLNVDAVERQYTFYGGICGRVKLVVMKVHASLQAVRLCMTRYRLRGRT